MSGLQNDNENGECREPIEGELKKHTKALDGLKKANILNLNLATIALINSQSQNDGAVRRQENLLKKQDEQNRLLTELRAAQTQSDLVRRRNEKKLIKLGQRQIVETRKENREKAKAASELKQIRTRIFTALDILEQLAALDLKCPLEIEIVRRIAIATATDHFLARRKSRLTEIADIEAYRKFQKRYEAVLGSRLNVLIKEGSPIGVVKSDWNRMIEWSLKVKSAIDNFERVMELVREKQSKHTRVRGSSLVKLRALLGKSSKGITDELNNARSELVQDDWNNGNPYPELTDTAILSGWKYKLLGSQRYAINPAVIDAVAAQRLMTRSYSALCPKSQQLKRISQRFDRAMGLIDELIKQHVFHTNALARIKQSIATGQVIAARNELNLLPRKFSDLDYASTENLIARTEKKLGSIETEIEQLLSIAREYSQKAHAYFFVPPLGLLKQGKDLFSKHDILIERAKKLFVPDQQSELSSRILNAISQLENSAEILKRPSMLRVRQWAIGLSILWLAIGSTAFFIIIYRQR
jgi:hypothetical protein